MYVTGIYRDVICSICSFICLSIFPSTSFPSFYPSDLQHSGSYHSSVLCLGLPTCSTRPSSVSPNAVGSSPNLHDRKHTETPISLMAKAMVSKTFDVPWNPQHEMYICSWGGGWRVILGEKQVALMHRPWCLNMTCHELLQHFYGT